jgi:hypothetical protein
MPSSSPALTSFFLLYLGTAHGSIGTRCRTLSALLVLYGSRYGYSIVIACDRRDNERDERHH